MPRAEDEDYVRALWNYLLLAAC